MTTSEVQELTERLVLLDHLHYELYALPDCRVGGPLHIVLDDFNTRDTDLDFCFNQATKCRPVVRILSHAIIELLRGLRPAERYAWRRTFDVEAVLKAHTMTYEEAEKRWSY